MPRPEAPDGTVDALAVDLLRIVTDHDPVLATRLGLHERDTDLPDLSAADLDAYERELAALRERVVAQPAAHTAARIDQRGLLALVDSLLASRRIFRPWRRNPLTPAQAATTGVMFPIVWDHLAHEHREAAVRGRCRRIPSYLAQARERLDPEDVPPLWARMGERSARGSVAFLRDVVPVAFPAVTDEAGAAADAMEAYASWVAEELYPAARGGYALGEDGLAYMLGRVHLLDETPAELAARGTELLERHTAEAIEATGGRDWREALAEVRADHPPRERLVEAYREELERLRRFCFDADLVTDPRAPAVLEATPEFLRPLMGYAAYLPPGPFGDAGSGKLWVTPPADDEGLADHSYGGLQPITAHEGYPGHHLQMTSVGRLSSVVRRLFLGTQLMVEGWGLYVEQLMHEAGYYSPAGRLAQLSLAKLRACRIIVDFGLHTGEMAVSEGVDLLVEHAGITRATAQSEVDRYTMTPTQPFTYLYGAEEIRRLRDDYRRRHGAGLREFHDALLTWGLLPPALVGEALAGEGG